MTDEKKSTELSGEFAGLSVSEAALAYKAMADTILATMYSLVADELLIRMKDRLTGGPRMTLLDVGTGMGHLAVQLAARFVGQRVMALDVSPDVLAEARRLGGISRGVFPVAGDGTRLPVRDGSVDVIASYGAVHHVPQKARLFSEVHRVLAAGGLALVIDLSADAQKTTVDAIAKHLAPEAAGAFLESVREAISPAAAEAILSDAGISGASVTTSPISRRAVAMNAWALRAAPMRVNPSEIIWGALITK
jgi:ubiquinone/menaquinone biosynthesis C-methylase UbiE